MPRSAGNAGIGVPLVSRDCWRDAEVLHLPKSGRDEASECASAVNVASFSSRPSSTNPMGMNAVTDSAGDQAVGKVTWACL